MIAKCLFFVLFCIFSLHAGTNDNPILSDKEKDFLKAHPRIVLGTGDTWAPYSIIHKDGTLSGYDVDILAKVNKSTGANFVLKLGNWSKIQKEVAEDKIDGLATLVCTPKRKEFLNFSTVYISLEKMIMVKKRNPLGIKTLKDLDGKIIVILKGNIADKQIADRLTKSAILYANTTREMLEFVIYGKADATFGNGATEYLLMREGLPYLENAFKLNQHLDLHFAIKKEWKEAITILNKGLATISEHEKIFLQKKWFFTKKNEDILFSDEEWEFIFSFIGLILIILLIFLYRQYQIKQVNKKLEFEVKQQIERLREKDIFLFQQHRLASIGEMIENISHQWRQPLSVINSSVMILDMEISQNTINTKYILKKLDEIEEMTEYMSQTIEDFRDFYKEDKHKTLFFLEEAIHNVLSLMKIYLKEVEVEVEVDANIEIMGIQNEFTQAILVILNNAKDALLLNHTKEPKIEIKLEDTVSHYRLSIYNNGGNIKENDLLKIFDPYFTTKHKSQGIGLGLYMAKMILDAMPSHFYAKNLNDGVIFYIVFDKEAIDERK